MRIASYFQLLGLRESSLRLEYTDVVVHDHGEHVNNPELIELTRI